MAAAQLVPGDRVLNVGTGIGVLIPYIMQHEVNDIIGCDLSPQMVKEARKRYPDVTFWCGDILDYPSTSPPFDAVFFNAVFGNFWDPSAVLVKGATLLKDMGCLILSHPMGASFTRKLHDDDPLLVPYPLPDKVELWGMIEELPLAITEFTDEAELYIAVLSRRDA